MSPAQPTPPSAASAQPQKSADMLEALGLPDAPEPLPRPVADSHTHADTTEEYSGLALADNLAAAASVGVTRMVQVGCDVASSQWALAQAEQHPGVVAAVALHPNDAARAGDDLDAQLAAIAELISRGGEGPRAAQNPLRGVGETGLDYYRTTDAAGQARQHTSFATHIRWAIDNDLTLVIHDRDAHDDILRVLDQEGLPNRIVMHCFSGGADFAQECLDRGAWLSFPGVITFGSAGPQREALAITPSDRILVETDAPFLTPAPERGKRNAPYLLPHTVRFIAEQRDFDLPSFCDVLTANTLAAFGGEWDEISATVAS